MQTCSLVCSVVLSSYDLHLASPKKQGISPTKQEASLSVSPLMHVDLTPPYSATMLDTTHTRHTPSPLNTTTGPPPSISTSCGKHAL